MTFAHVRPAVYCPRTSYYPSREVGLKLKDTFLRALADDSVQTVLLPLILLGVAFVAELAASKRPVSRNDASIGFDLLFAATGSHLAVLGNPKGYSSRASA